MLVVYLKCGLDPGVVACCCQVLQEKHVGSSITLRGKQMPFENKIDQTQDRRRGKCHSSKDPSQCHGRGFGSVPLHRNVALAKFLPIENRLQGLLKAAQDFWWGGPLHMLPVVSHGLDPVEASGYLVDVRLHFIAPVVPDYCQSCLGPLVPHSGQGATPHLQDRERKPKMLLAD